jgi:SAM-dependent methyltransferase
MKFPESQIAHVLLDGKKGIEIGPSAHNPFGLDTLKVGRDTKGTVYESEEVRLCGEAQKLDHLCEGDHLPFKDNTFDFVVASHVLEHFYDPIATLQEWLRVVKPYGLVFVIFPHKDRTFDKDKPRTQLSELLDRHHLPSIPTAPPPDDHHTIWITEDSLELCQHMNWPVLLWRDTDDKVGNGFLFVIQK